mmetsp:Transcript_10806/g.18327  ORF Transcript_10806/g.18327 Transcript_10806/m.18327 type:complete len:218 (+) Transcript_10806:291-944(+)
MCLPLPFLPFPPPPLPFEQRLRSSRQGSKADSRLWQKWVFTSKPSPLRASSSSSKASPRCLSPRSAPKASASMVELCSKPGVVAACSWMSFNTFSNAASSPSLASWLISSSLAAAPLIRNGSQCSASVANRTGVSRPTSGSTFKVHKSLHGAPLWWPTPQTPGPNPSGQVSSRQGSKAEAKLSQNWVCTSTSSPLRACSSSSKASPRCLSPVLALKA